MSGFLVILDYNKFEIMEEYKTRWERFSERYDRLKLDEDRKNKFWDHCMSPAYYVEFPEDFSTKEFYEWRYEQLKKEGKATLLEDRFSGDKFYFDSWIKMWEYTKEEVAEKIESGLTFIKEDQRNIRKELRNLDPHYNERNMPRLYNKENKVLPEVTDEMTVFMYEKLQEAKWAEEGWFNLWNASEEYWGEDLLPNF